MPKRGVMTARRAVRGVEKWGGERVCEEQQQGGADTKITRFEGSSG
jgi:hypothetical protein